MVTKTKKQQPRTLTRILWRNSATVALARLTSIGGFITGVVGSLNWSPLLGVSGFDRKQMLITAGVVLLIGISTELARSRTLNA